MFQQSILASEESRRPWAFSVSLLAQALLIAVAVLVPLLAKPMLPALSAAMVSLQPPRPPRAAAPPPPKQVVAARPQAFRDVLSQPRQMPTGARIIAVPMPPTAITGPTIPGAGLEGGVISRIAGVTVGPLPQPPVVEPQTVTAPIRVSSQVQAARIVRRVLPVYPPLARNARISGVVRLQAIVAVDGSIAELSVISGHPLLVKAAVDAVKQWRYRPTVLNGRPTPVDTQIEVNFTLGR